MIPNGAYSNLQKEVQSLSNLQISHQIPHQMSKSHHTEINKTSHTTCASSGGGRSRIKVITKEFKTKTKDHTIYGGIGSQKNELLPKSQHFRIKSPIQMNINSWLLLPNPESQFPFFITGILARDTANPATDPISIKHQTISYL
jgi:hypothetical protein